MAACRPPRGSCRRAIRGGRSRRRPRCRRGCRRPRRPRGEPADEDRQAPQHRLLGAVEQHRTSRPSPAGSAGAAKRCGCPRSARRKRWSSRSDALERHRPQPGGGELDREGHAVEATADCRDEGGGVASVRKPSRSPGAGPLHEERHASERQVPTALNDLVRSSPPAATVRGPGRLFSPSMPSVSRLVASTCTSGSAPRAVGHLAHAPDQVLAVVEDDEDMPGRPGRRQGFERAPGLLLDPKRPATPRPPHVGSCTAASSTSQTPSPEPSRSSAAT